MTSSTVSPVGHPRTASEARRVVRAELAGRCTEDIIHDAMLAVSELVANAIVHAQGEVRVASFGSGARIRVEVWDGDSHPPVLGPPPEPDADRGRGLHLVAAVCTDWGYDMKDVGKVVWFEMDLTGSPL